MQLVAYGAQDIYITGNPQITYFKVVYRRHTNFSVETIEHNFIGNTVFGRQLSAKITRNGDLVTKMYLRVTINQVNPNNTSFAWIRRLGHAMVKQVEIDLGGTKVDRQYGTWLDIWYELARQGDHETGYAKLIGDVDALTSYDTNIKPEYVIYIPLQFWFNRHVGLAVPLIALQYHDMYVYVEFDNVQNLVVRDCNFNINLASMKDATILVNYVYLDTEERRRFALVGHEYLIEQIQWNGDEMVVTADSTYRLDYNHPTKEIIWAMKNGNYTTSKAFLYYTNQDTWSVTDACQNVIDKSIAVGVNPQPIVGGTWIEVLPTQIVTIGTFNINNKNANSVFVNPTSFAFGSYGITDKIYADITINTSGILSITNIVTILTVRDFSIPVIYGTDTRYNVCDPIVMQFNNYGILIDGSHNTVDMALIQLNGYDRFDRREGSYFNYVQPNQCHTNTPADGINVYSFALFPEQHQPSGTANLSRIESTVLFVNFLDSTSVSGLPDLHFFNSENRFYIYALSYNILRIMAGLSGLAYTT